MPGAVPMWEQVAALPRLFRKRFVWGMEFLPNKREKGTEGRGGQVGVEGWTWPRVCALARERLRPPSPQ